MPRPPSGPPRSTRAARGAACADRLLPAAVARESFWQVHDPLRSSDVLQMGVMRSQPCPQTTAPYAMPGNMCRTGRNMCTTGLQPRQIVVFLILTFPFALRAQQAPAASQALTLDAAFERALAANPTLRAARLARPVATAGVAVAGERPNPEISYENERETPRQAIGTTFPIELGGKRSRRIALAEAGVAASDAEIARTIAHGRND